MDLITLKFVLHFGYRTCLSLTVRTLLYPANIKTNLIVAVNNILKLDYKRESLSWIYTSTTDDKMDDKITPLISLNLPPPSINNNDPFSVLSG